MADKFEIKQTAAEEVAYKLFRDVITSEDRPTDRQTVREYLLNTYAECLYATQGYRDWKGK